MKCFLIAAGTGNTAEHLIRLVLLTDTLQQAGSPTQNAKNVPIMALQAHGGLLFCLLSLIATQV